MKSIRFHLSYITLQRPKIPSTILVRPKPFVLHFSQLNHENCGRPKKGIKTNGKNRVLMSLPKKSLSHDMELLKDCLIIKVVAIKMKTRRVTSDQSSSDMYKVVPTRRHLITPTLGKVMHVYSEGT